MYFVPYKSPSLQTYFKTSFQTNFQTNFWILKCTSFLSFFLPFFLPSFLSFFLLKTPANKPPSFQTCMFPAWTSFWNSKRIHLFFPYFWNSSEMFFLPKQISKQISEYSNSFFHYKLTCLPFLIPSKKHLYGSCFLPHIETNFWSSKLF